MMKEVRNRQVIEREKDLAGKRDVFGESLPDISLWEEYISDKTNVATFSKQLETLEKATDKEMFSLEDDPGHHY